ncbi:30S ribosomal protein S4 [Methylacidiphilum kamchatkense Kam1]|uniref:Small ribosomal subunit protein uS4 n=1 Tax=Methylacidiphilum kamchatkense Kam1 TaxID=1202785 RepID=A0A0C1V6K7_9BACT|nr:30S ribosomal protein S4 [Methylacidiphilum kamchatkense]KIE59350.1 30S ribosomal protein S4 [Methylacidiphilum kamchatkense Kam1]QDQ42678.1 small subunit ribosomal protein S4 [Methylacidiphilum kamchatkense Kam1]
MAKYIGPKAKISRRFNVALFGPSKALERKPYPPGVHGQRATKKKSDYAVALAEKQKLRFMYGIMEKQFRRYFQIAHKKKGVTGEVLFQLLEQRLDNVVYRLCFATSRMEARQLVNHGHIYVNGKKVNIPSYRTKPGDVIEICPKPQSRKLALRNLEAMKGIRIPDWLSLEADNLKGTVNRLPTREEIQPIVNEQLVVELYSK